MISLGNLKTTLNAIKCLLNDYAKKKDVPTKLPNPNSLTFTGAATGKYDGSKPLMVKIPSNVQTDYNQNDSTAPDYMKNRPFYTGDTGIVKIDKKYLPFLPKPIGESYLAFSSPNSFTLATEKNRKIWDGTLEYFTSDGTWTVWDGTSVLSAEPNGGGYVLYLRGTGNTVMTGNSNLSWKLDGFDIACIGNIETLLDYATVESGQHPTMGDYCYSDMFENCTGLTRAPELPATTLSVSCYDGMFYGCTNLTQAPALPATTLSVWCYAHMFSRCTSLTQAPELPAIALTNYCYYGMFKDCASLTQVPELPATTLADSCYYDMFEACTSLMHAPALQATTLANECCYSMFEGCTSLTQAPALPATTLAEKCYYRMFEACTSLIHAPALPATTLANECYYRMFKDCTSLTQVPELPATTLADFCYDQMFSDCISLTQVPELQATMLTSSCYGNMFYNCTSLKLSETRTGEYTQEYRIPSSGDGTNATFALLRMFDLTGGTFTGTPSINKTYYLSSDNMIARGSEIATLNGYVKTMIDAIEIPSGGGSVPTNVSAFANDAGYLTLATLPKYEGVVE